MGGGSAASMTNAAPKLQTQKGGSRAEREEVENIGEGTHRFMDSVL
jgi:hypothetical protein